MLELTGLGSVFRGVWLLYWLVAAGCVAVALKLPRRGWPRLLSVSAALLVFGYLPVTSWIEQSRRDAFAREAWAYFKKKCETEAGEKIYKTFTGVKSVLLVKPLPRASENDLFDQYWMGDPYSSTSTGDRGKTQGLLLLDKTAVARKTSGIGFEFFETETNGYRVVRKITTPPFWSEGIESKSPQSEFGIAWNDVSTSIDRKNWVAGSRLQILDLRTKDVVAERNGFMIEAGFGSKAGQRRPWQSSHNENNTCPPVSTSGYSDSWFIFRVLQPAQRSPDAK